MTDRWQLGLGLTVVTLALLLLLVWIPNDTQTGLVEIFRRKARIGDALAPTLTALGLLAVGIALLVSNARAAVNVRIDRAGRHFLLAAVALLSVAMTLLVLTGPAAVALLNAAGAEVGSYRELRDTAPYKYLGYIVGGFVLVYGFIALTERRLRARSMLVAMLAVIALAALYDLPFDDLLLPPNGDQ